MANNNQENFPPPPELRRQTNVSFLLNDENVDSMFNPRIVPDGVDPLLESRGQFDFSPHPNGLDGLTVEDYENLARNNGWYIEEDEGVWSGEEEDLTDDSEDEQEEEEDNEQFQRAWEDWLNDSRDA